jgi:hypothetical protein
MMAVIGVKITPKIYKVEYQQLGGRTEEAHNLHCGR